MPDTPVICETDGPVTIITLNRPEKRNAVDRSTADALRAAFDAFEADENCRVAILTGKGGHFCAGADLSKVGNPETGNQVEATGTGPGPLGPTRRMLSKPVIAAVEGYAVAGGLELSLMCDMRVASETAIFGVFCRRFGVPLIDGGTVRLPRLIGESRAMDMILTGRAVPANEALGFGLANRVVPGGTALEVALEIAHTIAQFPQGCMLADRLSARTQWDHSLKDALIREGVGGYPIVAQESVAGARRFREGAGRHGSFTEGRGDREKIP